MSTHTRVTMDEDGMAALSAYVDARTVRPITEDVAEDMRRFVPVDTGALRATIRTDFRHRTRDALGRFTGLQGRVYFGDVEGVHGLGVRVIYHFFVEYGTSRMAAQPYARPAVYRQRDLGRVTL